MVGTWVRLLVGRVAAHALEYGLLSENEYGSLREIIDIVNRAVHGRDITPGQSTRVIDLAMKVLPHILNRRYIHESKIGSEGSTP